MGGGRGGENLPLSGNSLLQQHRLAHLFYVGELGWELYIPAEFTLGVYEAIVEAGGEFGLAHAGYHALDSLRMEKAYRHWGHDITDEDTPLEAGLGFAVKFDKAGGFIGREALLRQKQTGVARKLLQFRLLDPEPLLYHDEPVWRGNALAGHITSGAFGHTLDGAVGLGYVDLGVCALTVIPCVPSPCHSARSEAKSQNLLGIAVPPRGDSATARGMTGGGARNDG